MRVANRGACAGLTAVSREIEALRLKVAVLKAIKKKALLGESLMRLSEVKGPAGAPLNKAGQKYARRWLKARGFTTVLDLVMW